MSPFSNLKPVAPLVVLGAMLPIVERGQAQFANPIRPNERALGRADWLLKAVSWRPSLLDYTHVT
jgi:hypothetical protein